MRLSRGFSTDALIDMLARLGGHAAGDEATSWSWISDAAMMETG